MKRTFVLLALVFVLCAQLMAGYAHGARTNVLVGSFMPGRGTMYPVAVAIADFLGKNSNLDITVKSYSGPTTILKAVVSDRIQLASSAKAGTAANAYYGNEKFAGDPQKSLRAVITIAILQQAWVTTPSTGIKTIADLKGKKLPRYTAIPNEWADILMGLYGIDPKKDIETVPLPNASAAWKEIRMGRLDAAHGNPRHRGVLSIKEQAGKAVILPIPPDKLLAAAAKNPAVFRGAYTGYINPGEVPWINVDAPFPVMESAHSVYTNLNVANEMIYTYVKGLLDNWKKVRKLARPLKIFNLQFVQKPLPVPYHPGAIKAFKEKGIWTGDMEKAHQSAIKAHK